jgi:prepilin-type processing-associated H-X9-DG protein
MNCHPGTCSRLGKRAFTMLELLVVMVMLIIVGGCLQAALSRPRYTSSPQCIGNLKQIGLAFRIWSVDNADLYPTQYYTNEYGAMKYADQANVFRYFQVLSNELSNPKLLLCTEDKSRRAATNFVNDFNSSRMSFFIGLDANGSRPESLLAGDHHLTNGTALRNGVLEVSTNQPVAWTRKLHGGSGNVLFADGHVQQLSSAQLREVVAKRNGINQLAMPAESEP